ncbi:hypothetical protein TruAng_011779 [Truncatella angustata]|nr:hypothetical protein TruAng_011779 [Truncatella angustata]
MSRQLQQLLPRPGERDGEPGRPSSPIRSKRSTVRAACEPCRQKKTRCTAERPTCGPCRQRGIQCEYKTLALETHSMAQTRRYKAYEDLYGIIRRSGDDDAALLVKRIQSGEDVEALVRSIEEGDLLLQLSLRPEWRIRYDFPGRFGPIPPHLDGWPNPYLKSKLFGGSPFSDTANGNFTDPDSIGEHDRIYAIPFHVVKLADPRLNNLDLTKYTTVSQSKSLLRSLLEVYLLYEYPWNSFLHADFLLDDMIRGDNRHCSPLLINAIMAAAWHGYTAGKLRADFWRPDNLGYHFLAEAKRLLELEMGNPSFTTVQAAAIISLVCTVNGVDKLSWQYIRKAIELGRRVGLFDPNSRLQDIDHVAVVTTAWDLFNWQSWVCYHNFQVPLLIDPPPYPLPPKEDAIDYFGEIFVQYPGSESRTPIFHGAMHLSICEFRVIMNQIGARLFEPTDRPPSLSLDETYRARGILQAWYNSLPEELSPLNIAIPSHLLVQ